MIRGPVFSAADYFSRICHAVFNFAPFASNYRVGFQPSDGEMNLGRWARVLACTFKTLFRMRKSYSRQFRRVASGNRELQSTLVTKRAWAHADSKLRRSSSEARHTRHARLEAPSHYPPVLSAHVPRQPTLYRARALFEVSDEVI